MAPLPEEVQKFIDEPNLCIFVTLMKDGSPQATMVWVDHDGEHVIINTPSGSQKDRNLKRDRRVALCVIDHAQGRRYMQIRGRVLDVVGGDEALEHINKVSQKYSGRDYPFREGEQRVKIIIEPRRITTPRGGGRGDGSRGEGGQGNRWS